MTPAEIAKTLHPIVEQMIQTAVQKSQHEMQQWVEGLVRDMAARDEYLEQLVLSKEYPNDFAVQANDAWVRFIEAEHEKIVGTREAGEGEDSEQV